MWRYNRITINYDFGSQEMDQNILICPLNLVTCILEDLINAINVALNVANQ